MAEFVRVRDKDTKAEYDAPLAQVMAFPHRFQVIDKAPVTRPRSAVYPKKKATPKAEPITPKSVGDNRKDEDNG